MRTRSKLVLVATAAAALMAFAVGSASANRLSLSHTTNKAIWNPLTFKGGLGTTKCPVTLEQSFHSQTITKVLNQLIGYVFKASLGTCLTGHATILTATLPWHIQYGGFVGTLPRPGGIKERLIGASFRIEESLFGIECLSVTSTTSPSIGIAEIGSYEAGGNGTVTALTAEANTSIPCEGISGRFEGVARVKESGGLENVLIRLI